MKLLTLMLVAGGLAGQTPKTIPCKQNDQRRLGIQPSSEVCIDGQWWPVPTFTLTKAQLRFALISRVLSADEMAEVERLGVWLYSPYDGICPGNEICAWPDNSANQEHLRSDLLQQFKLRLAAEQAKSKSGTAVTLFGTCGPRGGYSNGMDWFCYDDPTPMPNNGVAPFIVPGGCSPSGGVCW